MAIAAFGVPVFTPDGNSKNAPVIVQEINGKLDQLGVPSENVINIHVTEEFYHVFYNKV